MATLAQIMGSARLQPYTYRRKHIFYEHAPKTTPIRVSERTPERGHENIGQLKLFLESLEKSPVNSETSLLHYFFFHVDIRSLVVKSNL